MVYLSLHFFQEALSWNIISDPDPNPTGGQVISDPDPTGQVISDPDLDPTGQAIADPDPDPDRWKFSDPGEPDLQHCNSQVKFCSLFRIRIRMDPH